MVESNDPQPLYVVSIDANRFESWEWASRLRWKLSQSQSTNEMYRFESWHFTNIPEALDAIRNNSNKDFVYLRIDPTKEVLETYPNPEYLNRELERVEKRNCIVIKEKDHTRVGDVILNRGQRSEAQANLAHNQILEALQYRTSGKSALLAQQIDQMVTMGTASIKDIRHQIGSVMKRCDRLEDEVETLQEVVNEHTEDLDKIRAFAGHGRNIGAWILKQGVFRGLLWLCGGSLAVTKIVELIRDAWG